MADNGMGNEDQASSASAAAPPSVEGYEIVRQLGRGGMGIVWLARQVSLGRLVALKVLRRHLGQDPELVERFSREARSVAALAHANVVTVHDFGHRDGTLWLAMAYLSGGSLADRLRDRGPLSPDEAVVVGAALADALACAHDHGIVHRDVKPSNVLFDDAGKAYLADFGIASVGEGTALTRTDTLLGTTAYLAPEMAVGAAPSPASDIYALGATLYEALAGRPPFVGADAALILYQHRFEPVPDLPDSVPAPLRASVMRALDKEPARRFDDAQAMGEALRRSARGEAVDYEPSPPPQTPRISVEPTGAQTTTIAGRPKPPAAEPEPAEEDEDEPRRSRLLMALAAVGSALALVLIVLLLAARSGDRTQTLAGATSPTQVPVTQPKVTQAPVTQPPVTQPPLTGPPVTQPPVTQPPPGGGGGGGGPTTTRNDIRPPVVVDPPNPRPPQITSTSTYTESALVYVRVNYTDPDGNAEGFGFRGANGSGWGAESHPFTDPSYGRVATGRVDYPFNLGCGSSGQYESDVEFWIYDSTALRSSSVVVHMKCPDLPPAQPPRITSTSQYREGPLVYLRVNYTDPDGNAEGFGFRGANGSGWGAESHPFTDPSYGRVATGRVDYPFNHGCGTSGQSQSDVEFWIYDSTGLKSQSVVAHLAC